MNMISRFVGVGIGLLLISGGLAAKENRFAPTWDSLRRHDTPQWLEDAKFGIYCHWGLQSVQRLPEHKGITYREAIPLFTAEKFDPEAWADLFVAAGADFAGPVSWHGSGYVHWDSQLTPWNSKAMSPHRDILGELTKAIRARGLKVLASFHGGYHYGFPHWSGNPEYTNPAYTGLYGPIHDVDAKDMAKGSNSAEMQVRMPEDFMRDSVAMMLEAVTRYQPDIVWLDTSFGGTTRPYNRGRIKGGKLLPDTDIYLPAFNERWQRDFISGVYNAAAQHGQEVEFVYKTWDVPPGIGMRDVENGLLDEIAYDPWMTDIDMNVHVNGDHAWFFQKGYPVKSANYLIDMLVDVVSKNGRMLLNVPPHADGTFSDDIRRELLAVGRWLKVNGEAIRGASPWFNYGEGPTGLKKTGHYSDSPADNHFGQDDIRYTTKGDAVYAIFLGWPGEKAVMRMLGSRGRVFEGEIIDITLLANGTALKWTQLPDRLEVAMPSAQVGDFAHVLKIRVR